MFRIKGMVQVGGSTYRIERVEQFHYQVVRINDDTRIGSFRTAPLLSVVSCEVEPELIQEVARAAVQAAKTAWVKRLSRSRR